ncbi:MAG: hypothetical protein JXA22_04940 [Candidatus Thermoplasmatota archaeon]|nr:hypothetical protein [Candidatus Thermoplasmatota archaeon]
MKTRLNGVWLSVAAIGFMLSAALIIASTGGVNGAVPYYVNVVVDGEHIWDNVVPRDDPYFSLDYPGSAFLVHIDPALGQPTWIDPDTSEVGDGYLGWCVEPGSTPLPEEVRDPEGYDAVMYSTLDLPDELQGMADWNEINWILNNKQNSYSSGVYGARPWYTDPYLHGARDIQHAIWHFCGGDGWAGEGGIEPLSSVGALITEAATHDTYVPDPDAGDIVGYVIHFADDPEGIYGDAYNYQDLLIEIVFPEVPEINEQTAWAFGETELNNLTVETKKGDKPLTEKWGWGFEYIVDTDSPYVARLWAGAGQNDPDNGEQVGWVTVSNDAEHLYISYDLFENYYLTSSHVYVGDYDETSGSLGMTTAAPGQFPYINGDLDDVESYDVPEIDLDDFETGDLFIAVHGVVWTWV